MSVWHTLLPYLLYFTGDQVLNELMHLYLEVNKNAKLYQPTRIGTFLHYMYINIMMSKQTKLIQEAFSYLQKLMTLKEYGLDLLMIIKLFGVNEFLNIPLLINYERPNKSMQSCLNHMTALMNQTKYLTKADSFSNKTHIAFIDKSPCYNLDDHPVCEDYCKWHAKVTETLTKEEILTLLG